MKSYKKIIFLLVLIFAFANLTQAQNEPVYSHCLISQILGGGEFCIALDGGPNSMTPEDCEEPEILITEQQYNAGACTSGCCCLEGDSFKQSNASCQSMGGKFIEGEGNCATICDSSTSFQSINLTGTIKDNITNNQISGKYTLFFDIVAPDMKYATGTFQNGIFNAVNARTGVNYVIIDAELKVDNKEYACSIQKNLGNLQTDTNLGEIKLECTQKPSLPGEGEQCVAIWQYIFENEGCGKVLDIKKINEECQNPSNTPLYQKNDIVPCVDMPSFLCGNNKLDQGEQCDIVNGNPEFGGKTCQTEGLSSGNLQCSNCIIDTSFCAICPATPSGCTNTLMCGCAECQGTEFCQPTNVCTQITLSLSPVFEKLGIKLDWITQNCVNENSKIKIFKKTCPDGQTTCGIIPTDLITQPSIPYNPNAFYDYQFESHLLTRAYCYKIELLNNNNVDASSDIVCQKLANDACIGKEIGEKFCHQNNIATCNEKGEIISSTVCDLSQGQKCVNPSDREPMCVSSTICDACSGPFGVFGFLMYESTDFSKNGTYCAETETNRMCFREDLILKNTAIGQFNECANVNTCYDYRTEGSCIRDSCGLEPACSWQPYMDGELGLGVCVPEAEEYKNCNLCDKNTALGGYCSQELCLLYGDCYYNENPKKTYAINQYYCNNKPEVGCETYNNPEQCEGQPAKKLTIDVLYNNALQPISGTNKIQTKSDDFMQRGLCVWKNNECIRDADYNSKNQDISSEILDCKKNDKACLTDFTTPNTTLLMNEVPMQSGEIYSAAQFYKHAFRLNVSEDNTKTYFSIKKASATTNNYPDMEFGNFAYHIKTYLNESKDEGQYVISYYSRDNAKNLEEIKTLPITLLTGMRININHEVSSGYSIIAGQVLSNVTIKATSTSQTNFICEGQLRNIHRNELIGPKITQITTNGIIQWNYNYREDSLYEFIINCYDDYDQSINTKYEFLLEEDNTISAPYPKGESFTNQSLTISINSKGKAECKYKGIGPMNLGVNGTFSSGQIINGTQKHTAQINTLTEGVYIFRPECKFEGETETFTGNNGDLIYFGIDRSAPELIIYDWNLGKPQNEVRYDSLDFPTRNLTLQFNCEDKNTNLIYLDKDYSFGCQKNMQFVLNYTYPHQNQEQITKEQGLIINGQSKSFVAPTEYIKAMLYINISDLGNNSKIHPIYLRIRNLDYKEPTVYICNPETQNCT